MSPPGGAVLMCDSISCLRLLPADGICRRLLIISTACPRQEHDPHKHACPFWIPAGICCRRAFADVNSPRARQPTCALAAAKVCSSGSSGEEDCAVRSSRVCCAVQEGNRDRCELSLDYFIKHSATCSCASLQLQGRWGHETHGPNLTYYQYCFVSVTNIV